MGDWFKVAYTAFEGAIMVAIPKPESASSQLGGVPRVHFSGTHCRRIITAFFAALVFWAGKRATATEITLIPDKETPIITIVGAIAEGDDDKFNQIASTTKSAAVMLYSNGGQRLRQSK